MIYPNFEEMDQSEKDKKDLLNFAKNPKGFVVLSGKNGSGKSYAAEAIYNMNTPFRLPQYDSDLAIFITQAEMNQEWIENVQEQIVLSKKYKETKLLIIDDLGTRKPTEAFMDFIYTIIDFRWRNRNELGTVITTNLNTDSALPMFGDAFVSRIASGITKRWDFKDRRMNMF